MTVTVVLRLQIRPEYVDAIAADFLENLPDTRGYDGCYELVAYRNQDNPGEIVEVQRWESREHYEKYISWRTETGMADHLISMLSGPPEIRYYDAIWPEGDNAK